jgi:hypothetical protein
MPFLPCYLTVNNVGAYNEDVFRALDRAVFAAKNQSIRVVVPLIDGSPDATSGGTAAFAALSGKDSEAFYSDPAVRQQWKTVVSYLLNRVNTVTGLRYKAEPAIAAWQLGSNLRSANGTALEEWAMDLSSYIKSEDPNHLVFDGSVGAQWSPQLLDHPAIDAYSNVHIGAFYNQPLETGMLIGLQIALFFFVVSGILLCVSPKWVKSMRDTKANSRRKINGLLALNAVIFAISTVAFGVLTALAVKDTSGRQDLFKEAGITLRRDKASLVSSFGQMDLKELQGFCSEFINSGASGAFLGELTFRNQQGGFCELLLLFGRGIIKMLISILLFRYQTGFWRLVGLFLAWNQTERNKRFPKGQSGYRGRSPIFYRSHCWTSIRLSNPGTGAARHFALCSTLPRSIPRFGGGSDLCSGSKCRFWDRGSQCNVDKPAVGLDRERAAHERPGVARYHSYKVSDLLVRNEGDQRRRMERTFEYCG